MTKPISGQGNGLSNFERQQQLLKYIHDNQRVSVQDIADHFAVSLVTARRDLNELAEQGKIKRFHGGALVIAPPELPVVEREVEQLEEKQRIARAAADLINDGDTIFISSGTTALEVARCLVDRRNLTVITNSVPVLTLLMNRENLTVIVLGGVVRTSERSLIGHITEQALAELRADKVIFGVRAIHPSHGLTNDYLPETMTDRAILKIGKQVIVVADHTKIGRVSTAFLAPLSAIHTLVTDSAALPEDLDEIRASGIEVVVA